MHAWLAARLPAWAADLFTALWFAALVLLVLYFAFEPQAEFRYERL
jgi:hypothetical protein